MVPPGKLRHTVDERRPGQLRADLWFGFLSLLSLLSTLSTLSLRTNHRSRPRLLAALAGSAVFSARVEPGGLLQPGKFNFRAEGLAWVPSEFFFAETLTGARGELSCVREIAGGARPDAVELTTLPRRGQVVRVR